MELLAVIVIIAVVVGVASVSINAVTKNAREKASEDMRESLKDAAITYIIDNDSIYLKKCYGSYLSNWVDNGCARQVSVSTLKSEGLFEDNKGYCIDSTEVIVYRDNNGYDAYLNNDACTNY